MDAEALDCRWESRGLEGVASDVDTFRVDEALDAPYSAVVELRMRDAAADVTLMLGEDAVLTVERPGAMRRFCGVVESLAQGHGHEGTGAAESVRVRVTLVPALALLRMRRDSRIFQGKTVPEILEEVLGAGLGDYGRSVELRLTGSYEAREYCVQYQETDFDFAHRLMEEEGIFYAFDHAGETETMILLDANGSCERVECASDPIEVHDESRELRGHETVMALWRDHRETTTSVTVRDWDWTAGGTMVVEENAAGPGVTGREHERYEHGLGRSLTITAYDAGARRYQSNDAATQPARRREAQVLHDTVANGVGRVLAFAPGRTFQLVNHPRVGLDGEYLITRVVHQDRPATSLMGATATDAEAYSNRFECIPIDVPHRPLRRTEKPRIPSIQTAIVTGPAGEEIHVDEHGRIKVQFHWDRLNPADDTSSCWIRVQQDWAGAGWGFWWVPRIGMEVVVQFVGGDPDRPLVTGCVYDAANPLPYPMPDEKTKSTIKSNSSPGGGGFNELRFEDKAGSEEIYTHAQRDYDEVVEHDHTTTVHNDQRNEVDNDQRQTIHRTQKERVDGDQTMTVGGSRTVHVEADFDETVDRTETRTTKGDVTETFDANETRSVGAALTETVGGDETRTIGGDQSETIGASQTQSIGGSSTVTIAGAKTQMVAGAVSTTTPGAFNLTAVGGMTVNAPAAVWKAPAGVTLIAPGGFSFIDGNNDWFGTFVVEMAGVADVSYTGMKIELGASSFGITGVKVSTYGINIQMGADLKESDGVLLGTVAGSADTGCRINLASLSVYG